MIRAQGWPYKKEFHCQRCGNCCRGEGTVDLTPGDVARASRLLGMRREEFVHTYCIENKSGDVVLRDQQDEEKSCIFLTEDEDGLPACRIHEAKPEQCSAFPMRWRPRDAKDYCEGMRLVLGLPPGASRRTVSG